MTLSWGQRVLWVVILIVWSALIAAGLTLLSIGLGQTGYFEPTGEALERARVGRLFILAGSVVLLGAAGWARWMFTPIWVCILVTAPAILVGGLTLLFENSLFPHLSVLVAFPAALAGLIGVLILARPMVRSELARSRRLRERHEVD